MLVIHQTEYFTDCVEALTHGETCSGIYTIKPDDLPSFDVSACIKNNGLYDVYSHSTVTCMHDRSIVTWTRMVVGGSSSRGEWMALRTSIVGGMTMSRDLETLMESFGLG